MGAARKAVAYTVPEVVGILRTMDDASVVQTLEAIKQERKAPAGPANFREAFKEMDDPIERARSFAHVLDTLVMIAEEDGEDNASRTHESLMFIGRETFLAVAAIHDHYHELWNEHHDREFAEATRRAA
ncbi:hypothetical protein [Aureimonas populi]|uniref:Uncharacterized protein n=1 Tax=Aureimonas populi TaxID=1701758 RepID=A0ABW5CGQ0_9HYPH|nr:hypothetical protein [Aureimonas populi]